MRTAPLSRVVEVSEPRRRAELARRLTEARATTDALFRWVTPEALYERPFAERHRLVFYLGHLEAFDWNLLCRDGLGAASLDPAFERLFAFGIDPPPGQAPADSAGDWPAVERVSRWVATARESVDAALLSAPLTGWLENGWAVHLAIEHRLMHAETLCYLLQRLELHQKLRGPLPDVVPGSVDTRVIDVPAGTACLGLSRAAAPHLGWDNEYGGHRVHVPAFGIARLPVSNGDWLRFLEAGGYQHRALWSDDGWGWREREGIDHPAFWVRRDGRWWWRAMFGELPLPHAWPVYVSHHEASAYARWAGGRLPSEAQWHRAAEGSLPGNCDFARFDPTTSGTVPGAFSAHGVADLVGNGWEWTSTPFAPFAGFEPLPFYRGYSADFFGGRHFVLKGASARTDATFLRPSFRNWYQPHFQHVFAKFRLAFDDAGGRRWTS